MAELEHLRLPEASFSGFDGIRERIKKGKKPCACQITYPFGSPAKEILNDPGSVGRLLGEGIRPIVMVPNEDEVFFEYVPLVCVGDSPDAVYEHVWDGLTGYVLDLYLREIKRHYPYPEGLSSLLKNVASKDIEKVAGIGGGIFWESIYKLTGIRPVEHRVVRHVWLEEAAEHYSKLAAEYREKAKAKAGKKPNLLQSIFGWFDEYSYYDNLALKQLNDASEAKDEANRLMQGPTGRLDLNELKKIAATPEGEKLVDDLLKAIICSRPALLMDKIDEMPGVVFVLDFSDIYLDMPWKSAEGLIRKIVNFSRYLGANSIVHVQSTPEKLGATSMLFDETLHLPELKPNIALLLDQMGFGEGDMEILQTLAVIQNYSPRALYFRDIPFLLPPYLTENEAYKHSKVFRPENSIVSRAYRGSNMVSSVLGVHPEIRKWLVKHLLLSDPNKVRRILERAIQGINTVVEAEKEKTRPSQPTIDYHQKTIKELTRGLKSLPS